MAHIETIERNASASLLSLLNKVNAEDATKWGLVRVRKEYLRPMTHEGFMRAVKPTLEEASSSHVFFMESGDIVIAWQGKQKSIYRQISLFIHTTFMEVNITVEPTVLTTYINPVTDMQELKNNLAAKNNPASAHSSASCDEGLFDKLVSGGDIAFSDEEEDHAFGQTQQHKLTATPSQRQQFKDVASQKLQRKQLHILVVEDRPGSSKTVMRCAARHSH